MSAWCMAHPWLTTFLVVCALLAAEGIADSISKAIGKRDSAGGGR